jgi:hypothetical protein
MRAYTAGGTTRPLVSAACQRRKSGTDMHSAPAA